MQSGFFLDQLIIPGTRYIGRLPWSELQPGLKGGNETGLSLLTACTQCGAQNITSKGCFFVGILSPLARLLVSSLFLIAT